MLQATRLSRASSLNSLSLLLLSTLTVACGDTEAALPVASSTAPVGACDNAVDQSGRARDDYRVGDQANLAVTEVATACAVECFGTEELGSCILRCIDEATMGAVSSSCASCDTAAAICAIDNCLSPCISDPTSEECIDCRCGSGATTPNCVGDFETCAGIESQVCAGR